jgi:hypothetical protein
MSADSGDSLRIPIEIKTEDLDEIRQLINDITKAQSDLHSLKAVPQKGRGTGDNSSRSAFTPSQDSRDGGIFNQRDSPTLPTQGRDKTSKTPVQKENEFAKLQNQVKEQEARSGATAVITSGLGMAQQGAVNLATSGKNGKFVLGSLGKMASKSFLPLALIATITEIATGVMDAMIAPGGMFDRRFRRNFKVESLNLSSLKEKAEITFGRRIVRVTTISSQRGGTSQVRSNLDYVKNGVDTFDINGTFNKGIGAGII